MIECSLLALDYSQIELRVAAHESQDPTMLDIFRGGGDMHMTTACHMFDLPPEKIDDKKHRRPKLTSTEIEAELHEFALRIGLKPKTRSTKNE